MSEVNNRKIALLAILVGLSLVLVANVSLANTHIFRFQKKWDEFQIGEEWSRVTAKSLTSSEAVNKAIKATAFANTNAMDGTAFYLGKFNGEHLMVTNYHVMPYKLGKCKATVYFAFQGRTYSCKEVLAVYNNLEAVFFTIKVDAGRESNFDNIALKFDFENEYKPGERLVTAGYGRNNNPRGKLTYENSQTCVVATTTYQTRFLKSKKENGIEYGAYSFAHACETSHSDSGSPLISDRTGKVVGLNWSTSTKKTKELSNTMTVYDWISHDDSRIWSYMSYGVPAKNIAAMIRSSNNLILNEFVSSSLQ